MKAIKLKRFKNSDPISNTPEHINSIIALLENYINDNSAIIDIDNATINLLKQNISNLINGGIASSMLYVKGTALKPFSIYNDTDEICYIDNTGKLFINAILVKSIIATTVTADNITTDSITTDAITTGAMTASALVVRLNTSNIGANAVNPVLILQHRYYYLDYSNTASSIDGNGNGVSLDTRSMKVGQIATISCIVRNAVDQYAKIHCGSNSTYYCVHNGNLVTVTGIEFGAEINSITIQKINDGTDKVVIIDTNNVTLSYN